MYSPDRRIYLDNNATTALDPEVLQAMMPHLTHAYGNASSTGHAFGWEAKHAVESARKTIATAINAAGPNDIVFMSGATESINLAMLGLKHPGEPGHVVTSTIEHKAVLDCAARLQSTGTKVTYVTPQVDGIVAPEAISKAITSDTRLVSIMAANNEIGTLQKLQDIGAICRAHGVLFHTDATQLLGKVPLDVQRMNIGMASFSAHKIYGPKGVGALFVNSRDPRIELSPLIIGGGQERGLRSGTLNVAGIVGFGRAVELAMENLPTEPGRLRGLRDVLQRHIVERIPDVRVNGHSTARLPGLLNVSFDGIDADSLLLALPGIALSSGSACTSAQQAPSHVLKAIGVSDAHAQGSVRFGLGRFTTEAEIRDVCQQLEDAVETLRSMAPHKKAGS